LVAVAPRTTLASVRVCAGRARPGLAVRSTDRLRTARDAAPGRAARSPRRRQPDATPPPHDAAGTRLPVQLVTAPARYGSEVVHRVSSHLPAQLVTYNELTSWLIGASSVRCNEL